MLSYAIDWGVVGIVVYVIGKVSGPPPTKTHPVALFFGVVILWPIVVASFFITCVSLIRVLVKKHGIR